MKTAISTLLLFSVFFLTSVNAQEAGPSASQAISDAQTALKTQNYEAALRHLTSARSAISAILTDQVLVLFPKTVGEFTMRESQNEMHGEGGARIDVQRIYTNAKIEAELEAERKAKMEAGGGDHSDAEGGMGMDDDMMREMMEHTDMHADMMGHGGGNQTPTITLTITNDANRGMMVAMAHSQEESGGGMYGEGTSEPMRIDGYRALLQYQEKYKSGELTVVVGGAVISAQGYGLTNKADLNAMIKAIDFAKVKSVMGE